MYNPKNTTPPVVPVPANHPLTDVGNAQRLVTAHGIDLRYCPAWKKWLKWDDKRWKVDDTNDVCRLAKETIRAFGQAAMSIQDTGKKRSAIQHALNSESSGRIEAMTKLAQSEPGIAVTPNMLDRYPYLLNCLNGTIDLKTGTLTPYRHEHLITKLAPVEYDPDATCPQFTAFLEKIMCNDQGLIAYLQRAIGYSLTADVGEKALFFLYGDGNNGKTTFLETVRAVLGEYAAQLPIESLMTRNGESISNDIARLKGARLVTSSEAEQGRKLAEAKVKQMTGMGKLQARFLYGEYFEFDPTFKIFMDANYKPDIRGTDQAIWNRIKLVPFTVSIRSEEIDKHLLQKLKGEVKGILAWAVRGCLAWQKEGLKEPAAVQVATQQYRVEMDTIAFFLEDECVLGKKYSVTSKDLYEAYKTWCNTRDEEPVSQKHLGTEFKKRDLQDKKVKGQRGWAGITLKGNEAVGDTEVDGTGKVDT